VEVKFISNIKKVQLLAYLAWRQGELVDRDLILEHIFGWGLSDEEATPEKLSERFDAYKKLLRRDIKKAVMEQINTPARGQVLDPNIAPFVRHTAGFWGLSPICRVEDLATVDACTKVIARARHEGRVVDQIPQEVKRSCEQLIGAYAGDFLA